MSNNECPVCFKKYNKEENKPYILECGDSLCLKCIDSYKEILGKKIFECPICCQDTKSTGIMNKAIPLDDAKETNENKYNNNNNDTMIGFFEITIKPKNSNDSFAIKVKKEYSINQVKQIIYKEKKMPPENYNLAWRRPLIELDKTLEYYGITKTVTILQISNVIGGI